MRRESRPMPCAARCAPSSMTVSVAMRDFTAAVVALVATRFRNASRAASHPSAAVRFAMLL